MMRLANFGTHLDFLCYTPDEFERMKGFSCVIDSCLGHGVELVGIRYPTGGGTSEETSLGAFEKLPLNGSCGRSNLLECYSIDLTRKEQMEPPLNEKVSPEPLLGTSAVW